jgi:hypothetical protein
VPTRFDALCGTCFSLFVNKQAKPCPTVMELLPLTAREDFLVGQAVSPVAAGCVLWGRLKTCAPVGNRRPRDAPNYSISSPCGSSATQFLVAACRSVGQALRCNRAATCRSTVRKRFARCPKLSQRAKKQHNQSSVIAQTPVLHAPLTCSPLWRTITTSSTRGVQNV